MLPLEFNGLSIQPSPIVKLLGVTIDDKLSGAAHVKEMLKRLAASTHATRLLKNVLGASSCPLLYNSFFLSHVTYGAEYWTVCTEEWLQRLQVAQNRFLRMFRGSASIERLAHGILPIHALVRYLILLIVFKNLYKVGPQVLSFEQLGNARNTRATGNVILRVRSHKSRHCSLAFGARAVREWNLLPADL